MKIIAIASLLASLSSILPDCSSVAGPPDPPPNITAPAVAK